MNMNELERALKKLRIGGMAETLETRILEAQSESLDYIDFFSALVQDELTRRADRLVARRLGHAKFRDVGKTLDTFNFAFNGKMPRKLLFELAAGHFMAQAENILLLGPPGTGKTHLAHALGHAMILLGHRVLYREAHDLVEQLALAQLTQRRKETVVELSQVPLLIIDDIGMRKLPATAAEDLLEIVMRRYERHPSILVSNRPVEDWGKLLGDNAAVSAMLDRLLHHAHVVQCGPKSYRTQTKGN